MSDDDKAEGEGFVIKDSRSSQLSEEEAETHDTKESTSPTDTGKENQPQEPFQIDFSTFIMSLTSSAFYHLGELLIRKQAKQKPIYQPFIRPLICSLC
ncbi:MAG: hypothetical protein CM1200mP16_10860 [Nitrospina sp.]|nr:MAG: hypothetical protein CM1200mP16_10860 [Nitrospina sp.]